MMSKDLEVETSAKHHFVILSGAKDLVFSRSYEILRSLRSLRMTSKVTYAEVPSCSCSRAVGPPVKHEKDGCHGRCWCAVRTLH
jgi:hypothetical protein